MAGTKVRAPLARKHGGHATSNHEHEFNRVLEDRYIEGAGDINEANFRDGTHSMVDRLGDWFRRFLPPPY